MKNLLLLSTVFYSFFSCAQSSKEYAIVNTYHIASPGGWDYITINGGKLYVTHSTQVNILNEDTGDSIGLIPNTNGVHGIAFDNELSKGFTSNGRDNNVTVFDLKTNAELARITTSENPDAILYEPYTKTIVTCNGRGKNLSFIDPKTDKVIATTDVGGKPETAVSDEEGKIFVNIEDKNEIVEVDIKSHAVKNRWPLNGAEGPTGLAYDKHTKRLFAGCEKTLVVMNAVNGKIIDKLPIGAGCDGVAFDTKNQLIYASNGEGTLTVIKELNADKFSVEGNYATKRGARTIALDDKTGTLFLPTADFEANTTPNTRPKMIRGTFQVLVVKSSKK